MMLIIVKLGKLFLNMLYAVLKLFPTRDRIVMISRQSDSVPFEYSMLEDALKKQKEGIEVIILCKTLEKSMDAKKLSMLFHNLSYVLHIVVQMYYLATSKIALLDGYCIAASLLKHKKKLVIVQMWHSMGTMKLFGYGILDQDEGSDRALSQAMNMHKNYDYYFASSTAYIEHLAKGFNCSTEKARIFPLPRYDLLMNKTYQASKKEEILNTYPILKEGKTIVYCPTLRKDDEVLNGALAKLESCIPEGYHLVVKLHPLTNLKIANKHSIYDNQFTTMEMLSVADYIISDYSCVIYEAAILDIPLCFYNFDFGKYQESRGFAIDYENELPGVISPDPLVLIDAIKHDAFDKAELQAFADKYVQPTKNATNDIACFLINKMEHKEG